MEENFARVRICPSKVRIVPNCKLAKATANLTESQFQSMVVDHQVFCLVEARNHKKYGDIVSEFILVNTDDSDNTDPLTFFDYCVLSVCISEWKKGNHYTTLAIIYRGLTGKIGKSNTEPQRDQLNAIRESIKKLMTTILNVDLSDVNQKFKYRGGSPKMGVILPCKFVAASINGQILDNAIYLYDESPILTVAEARNQLIRYDGTLLDVPNQHNTPMNVVVKNYAMLRVQEIKKHRMTPTITLKDIFQKARIADKSRKTKRDAREVVSEFLEHLQTEGEIESFDWVKEDGTFQSVKILV